MDTNPFGIGAHTPAIDDSYPTAAPTPHPVNGLPRTSPQPTSTSRTAAQFGSLHVLREFDSGRAQGRANSATGRTSPQPTSTSHSDAQHGALVLRYFDPGRAQGRTDPGTGRYTPPPSFEDEAARNFNHGFRQGFHGNLHGLRQAAQRVPNYFAPGSQNHQDFNRGFEAAFTGNLHSLFDRQRHAPNVPNARNPFQPGTLDHQNFARGFEAARSGNAGELGREMMGRYAPERFFGDANRRNQG